MHERAERRNARARSYHDDVAIRRRQPKMPIRPQLDPNAVAALDAFGDEVGGDAFTRPAMTLVANRGNKQMRFLADLAARGGKRIGAGRERSRERPQVLGAESGRNCENKIDEPPTRPGLSPAAISALTSPWPVTAA